MVAAHEMSNTLRGATYGMQNAMELRHSCLIAHHMKQYIERGNLEDAKHNGNTTFMFDIF